MSAKSSNKDNTTALNFDQSVGEVVTFVGLQGTMKVVPSSNNPTLFLDIKNVLLQNKKVANINEEQSKPSLEKNVEAKIKSIKLVKNCFEMRLENYDSRNAVEHLRGAIVLTPKSQLRELSANEWWAKDLIGMTIYTTTGNLLGTVFDITGEHGEFLEIKKANDDSSKTVVISFAKELFPVVDMENRRIEMVELQGLFE